MSDFVVIGATSFVGSKVCKHLIEKGYDVKGTGFSRKSEGLEVLDITDANGVKRFLEKNKPKVIIVPAAIVNAEFCETNKDEAWRVNVEGVKNVIENRGNSKVVYFSSDYVFDGKNGPYSEIDIPNPINFYGVTKLAVENKLKSIDSSLIIRSTVIYGWDPNSKNFIMQLISKLSKNEQMNVPNDQYGTPTYGENLAEITLRLIEADKSGIYHVVGPDYLNRYDFAVKSAKILGLDHTLLRSLSTSEIGQVAKRPLKAGLKTDKLRKELNVRLVNVSEGISNVKRQMIL